MVPLAPISKDAPEFVRVAMRYAKYIAHVAYAAGVFLRVAEVVISGLRASCDTVVANFGQTAPQGEQG